MSEPIHVGSEIEAFCGSCKEQRWHVIVALVGDRPVKVECLSCKKQHGFRTSASTPSPRSSGSRAPRSTPPTTFDLSALQARASEARTYSPSETFLAGDVVRHPSFGLGLVASLAGPQRIDVRFPSGPKVLVHDRKPR
jgi:hypothetical protein